MPITVRSRADACPGVLSPHDAADGALARIRLPGGVVTAAALHAIADVADLLGDGDVHLTSRGNLQLRGLDRADPALVRRLAGAGLLPSTTHERVRNVLASPASGLTGGIADVRGMAAALDRELCARPGPAALPGRFLFAIDDGRGDVAAERPDVCWLATEPRTGSLLVAGADTGLGCPPDQAPALLCDAAEAFLAVRAEQDDATPAWRAAEVPDAARRVAAALGDRFRRGSAEPPGVPGSGGSAEPHPGSARTLIGPIPGSDAIGVAPVLGRLRADDTRLLAELAPSAVVTPWRTVLLPEPHDPTGAPERLRRAGLVVDPDSPALLVSACAGRPGCAKSLADVRAHARDLTPAGPVHVAGCERRCGAPHTPHTDVVATDATHYAVDGVIVPVPALAGTLHRTDPEETLG